MGPMMSLVWACVAAAAAPSDPPPPSAASSAGPPAESAPAALVRAVLDALPEDVHLTSLHWDGRRMWLVGDGAPALPTSPPPMAAGSSMAPAVMAASVVHPPEQGRRTLLVGALQPVRSDPTLNGPSPLEAQGVWMEEPRYLGDLVVVRGLAASPGAIRSLERRVQQVPCLGEVAVSTRGQHERPISVTVSASVAGDLLHPDCWPSVEGTAPGWTAPARIVGDWSDIWAALSAPAPVPLEQLTIWNDGAQLHAELRFLPPTPAAGRRTQKAIAAGSTAASPRLTQLGQGLSEVLVDATPDALLGTAPPADLPPAELGTWRADTHADRLHAALAALDTPLHDLEALRWAAIQTPHPEVSQITLHARLVGLRTALDATLATLDSHGVAHRTLPSGGSTILPPATAPAVDLPDSAQSIDVALDFLLPVSGDGPNGVPAALRRTASTPPASPFSRPAHPGQPSAPTDTEGIPMDPLATVKIWRLQYRGFVGGNSPRGLIETPDGAVHVVSVGDRVGLSGATVRALEGGQLHAKLATASEVQLDAAPMPPDEAPAPSPTLARVSDVALRPLQRRFPAGETVNIDLVDVPLDRLLALLADLGGKTELGPSLPDPLPSVSLRVQQASVGSVLADLQVALLPQGLVFDDDRVLQADAEAAKTLRAGLFSMEPVPTDTVLLAGGAIGPEAATDLGGDLDLRVAAVSPTDLLRLLAVDHIAVSRPLQPVALDVSGESRARMLGHIDARLQPAGHALVLVGERVVVVPTP